MSLRFAFVACVSSVGLIYCIPPRPPAAFIPTEEHDNVSRGATAASRSPADLEGKLGLSFGSGAHGCPSEPSKTFPETEFRVASIDAPSPSLLEAEELSGSWRGRDKRRAIEAFRALLGASFARRDRRLEGRASVRLGDLHRDVGRAGESVWFYERALEVSADAPLVRIDAHDGLARSLMRLDDLEGGARHARRALELSRALGDGGRAARALITVGIAAFDARELERSVDHMERAWALAVKSGDSRLAAEASLHAGFARTDLNEEWRAIGAFRYALAASRRLGEGRLEALALLGLGNTYSKIGEKQRALEHYSRAMPRFHEIDDPYESAPLFSGMGFLYDQLGDYPRARDCFSRARQFSQAVDSLYGEAGNLLHLGRTQVAMGEFEDALATLSAALPDLRQLGDRRLHAVVLGEIGAARSALGLEAGALEAYSEALAIARAQGYEREEAELLNGVGEIELARDRLDRAHRRFRRALYLSRKTDSLFTESRALFNLARVERASGDPERAQARVRDALDLVESLRSRITSHRLRVSYVASVYELHAFHVDLLMELHERAPGAGFHERAFLAAERARARSLLEMLVAERGRGGWGEAVALRDYAERLEGRMGRARDAPYPAEIQEISAELDRVRGLLRALGAESAPRETAAPLVDVRELQRELLDERTGLLAYFLSERASYLWVVTRARSTVHRLPPGEEIASRARSLQALLAVRERRPGESAKERYDRFRENDHRYWQAASPFAALLLEPALRDLEVDRLVIVGDGVLYQFPFSALPLDATNRSEAPTPLVARYEIVRLPSASILRALDERSERRTRFEKKLAVLADPVFDARDPRLSRGGLAERGVEVPSAALAAAPDFFRHRGVAPNEISWGRPMPRLLSTRNEASRILELVPRGEGFAALGFEANRALVTSGDLAGYEVVHFATHGILNSDEPELSGILLSLFDAEGKSQDGFLRLRDIYELDLPVRLVVLSACSTGLGKEIRGEGLVGLVGGFLLSGTSGVVASYWDVDDEATAELMKRFYAHLFAGALAPPRALQLAQSSMWKERRWLSPYYWGAFEFQGQWR